jgi:hypothetical protein
MLAHIGGIPVEEWLMPFIAPRVPRYSASAPCWVRRTARPPSEMLDKNT